MSTFSAIKDGNALLDYTMDWEPFLGNDQIDSAAWVVPNDLTSEAETITDTTATIWLSGGITGMRYDVTCRITSIGGRVDDRTILIVMADK